MSGPVSVGIYWTPAIWDLARSAYVADLDTDPDAPGAFVGWLERAIGEHVRRSPTERAAVADKLEQLQADYAGRRKGFNKQHPLQDATIEDLEASVVTDREELGRMTSRSGFTREAVVAAAEKARARYGRDLPPPPAKLSNRPPRRRRLS